MLFPAYRRVSTGTDSYTSVCASFLSLFRPCDCRCTSSFRSGALCWQSLSPGLSGEYIILMSLFGSSPRKVLAYVLFLSAPGSQRLLLLDK